MKLNIDYVQLALHMRHRFDFRDKIDQINIPSNYKRLDLSHNYFILDLN